MLAIGIITIVYLILLYLDNEREAIEVTPDGQRYYSGNRLIMPYHIRWLLPYLCRQSEMLWNIFTIIPVALIPIMTYKYLILKGFTEDYAILGGIVALGLPGVIIVNFYGKYLTDGFGMFCLILSLVFFEMNLIVYALITASIGTMANEKVTIFSFLITLNFLFLIPIIFVLARILFFKKAETDFLGGDEIAKNPLQAGIKYHRALWFDVKTMLLPWGVAVFGIINLINEPLFIIPVFAGYLMLLLATDTVRLYMWSYPVLIVSFLNFLFSLNTFSEISPVVIATIGILHIFNPFRRYMI